MNNAEKINVLVEALPYINRFKNHIIVIKYGGNAMISEELKNSVMQDIALMKSVGMKPVIVHGGGPFISGMLDRLDMESEFIEGLRVSDPETTAVAEMVLAGQVNKNIVSHFNKVAGSGGIGLTGKDGQLIKAKKKEVYQYNDRGEKVLVDLGQVGEVTEINTSLLKLLLDADYVPIVSTIGADDEGNTYNINADYVAGEIAAAIRADKFIFLTDIKGVLLEKNDPSSLISLATTDEIENLIHSGVITEGMIPKVETIIQALENGVKQAHIVDGRDSHSLLLEIFFDQGVGTMIVKEED